MYMNLHYIFSDAIVGQVLDELGLQMADELTGKRFNNMALECCDFSNNFITRLLLGNKLIIKKAQDIVNVQKKIIIENLKTYH